VSPFVETLFIARDNRAEWVSILQELIGSTQAG